MYKTYKCVDCGHINVFKSYRIDGIRCMKCKGDLTYIGYCSVEKSRDSSIKIGCDTSEIDTALKKVNSLNDRLMQSEIYLNKLNLESDEKCIDSRGKEECKYCNPQKVDEYGTRTGKYIPGIRKDNNSDGMWFYIINDNWLLRSHGYDICNQIKPNYCPMCGRKLNDK